MSATETGRPSRSPAVPFGFDNIIGTDALMAQSRINARMRRLFTPYRMLPSLSVLDELHIFCHGEALAWSMKW